jgi:Variant SH3 domain
VLFSYKGATSTELSLEAGQTVVIITMDNPEWWQGYIEGTDATKSENVGFFPKAYVELVELEVPPHEAPRAPRSQMPKATIKDANELRQSLRAAQGETIQPHKICEVVWDYEGLLHFAALFRTKQLTRGVFWFF